MPGIAGRRTADYRQSTTVKGHAPASHPNAATAKQGDRESEQYPPGAPICLRPLWQIS